jgi:hypothetical protein
MDITLTRFSKTSQGIFSKVTDTQRGAQLGWACEHAYVEPGGDWEPKIPPGEYTCHYDPDAKLGEWPKIFPFPTYQVMDVPGHTGILIHTGNTESASEGCILLGLSYGSMGGVPAVFSSRAAWQAFMATQMATDGTYPDFTLTVVDPLAGTIAT